MFLFVETKILIFILLRKTFIALLVIFFEITIKIGTVIVYL